MYTAESIHSSIMYVFLNVCALQSPSIMTAGVGAEVSFASAPFLCMGREGKVMINDDQTHYDTVLVSKP